MDCFGSVVYQGQSLSGTEEHRPCWHVAKRDGVRGSGWTSLSRTLLSHKRTVGKGKRARKERSERIRVRCKIANEMLSRASSGDRQRDRRTRRKELGKKWQQKRLRKAHSEPVGRLFQLALRHWSPDRHKQASGWTGRDTKCGLRRGQDTVRNGTHETARGSIATGGIRYDTQARGGASRGMVEQTRAVTRHKEQSGYQTGTRRNSRRRREEWPPRGRAIANT